MSWLLKPLPAALVLVALWSVCRLAFLAHTGIPQPAVHDEFSYLVEADTFAHGRLANPPHPLAKFFESPHLIMHPTYSSKFPPGQPMFLALGQVLFGAPFYGVLIGNALMLFTFCLMLFAWVPPRWALAVSAMFGLVLWPGMYWTNTYWGGSVAASGGALLLLGIGIHRTKQTVLAGALSAFGVLLLFWTRPFEGGVFTLLLLIVFGREIWQKRRARVLVTAFSILIIGGAWSCYDNYAVTGNAFLFPHILHEHQYQVQPLFWFQPLRPEPSYSSPRLAALHGLNGLERYDYYDVGHGVWHRLAIRFLGPLLTLRLELGIALLFVVVIPVAWREPLFRKMAFISGVFLLALGIESSHFEHYTAPVWAALAVLIAVWAQRAWSLRFRGAPIGAALVLVVLVSPILLASPFLPTVQAAAPRPLKQLLEPNGHYSWPDQRAALIKRLSALDRPQLVFVRYPSPGWHVDEEWVYNGADIDHQKVVLAHDFGPEQDRALLDYYPGRTAWLLTFDPVGTEHLNPYPVGAGTSN